MLNAYIPIFQFNFYSVFIWAVILYNLPLKKQDKSIIYLSIIFIQFTLLAWQKDFSVGQDTLMYCRGFDYISSESFKDILLDKWEPGYVISNWIIGNLGFDFHTYLLIVSGFIYYSVCRFIFRYSQYPWLSVAIFVAFGYYFGSLHILRQYIAIAIILYSYDCILNRKFASYLALVLLAASFHTSAIVFLPTYFLYGKSIRPTMMIVLFSLSLAIALIAGDVLLNMFVMNDRYQDAYVSDKDGAGSGYGMLLFMTLIFSCALLLKPKYLNKHESIFYWIFFISLCMQPLSITVSMVSRAILYWSLSLLVLLPMIIHNIKSQNLRFISFIIVLSGLIFVFEFITNANEGIETYATYEFYTPA